MKTMFRTALLIVCIPLAAFCAFGFLATFEPGDQAMRFRVLYGVLGLGSLGIIGAVGVAVARDRPRGGP